MQIFRHLIHVVCQVLHEPNQLSDLWEIQLQQVTVENHRTEQQRLLSDSEDFHFLTDELVFGFRGSERLVNHPVVFFRHHDYRSMLFFLQLCRRDKSTISSSGFTMGFSPKAAEIFSTA